MIAEANREIRWRLRLREERCRRQARIGVPFTYVDRLIVELELLHLDGCRTVPASFLPELFALNRLLPAGVKPIVGWRRRIRDAIEQCFELQEQLLALRDPGYRQRLEEDRYADAGLGDGLEARISDQTP